MRHPLRRDLRTDSAGDIYARERSSVQGNDHFAYAYDGLNRLVSVSGAVSETFTLDPASNISARTGPSATNTFDGSNRMTADGTRSFVWDGADRLIQRGADTFSYDPLSRMTGATVSGATRSYAYDGDGLLVSRAEGGGTSLLWDTSVAPAPLLVSGTDRVVYGLGPLYLVHADGSTTTLARDGLGSVRGEVDDAGVVSRSFRYAAYGTLTASPGGSPALLGFAGELGDPSGLIYLRARWYDASAENFVVRDRLPGQAAIPGSLNRYGYAHASPVNNVDPTGLVCVGVSFGGSAVLGIGQTGMTGTTSLGLVICGGGARGLNFGLAGTFGGFAGGPENRGAVGEATGNAASGAYAGFGFAGLASPNAVQVSDFAKEFRTEAVNLGIGPLNGSVDYSAGTNDKGGAVDVISVTPPFLSGGIGASYSLITTWTLAREIWAQRQAAK